MKVLPLRKGEYVAVTHFPCCELPQLKEDRVCLMLANDQFTHMSNQCGKTFRIIGETDNTFRRRVSLSEAKRRGVFVEIPPGPMQ